MKFLWEKRKSGNSRVESQRVISYFNISKAFSSVTE